MAYVLITEDMTAEQQAELDERLTGPDRTRRAAIVAVLGGDVRTG